ncbi:MAG: S8 family serine peptidase [Candidatus Aminicenantia bacterium]
MKKLLIRIYCIILCMVFFQISWVPAKVEASSKLDQQLNQIFEDAKGKFFTTINNLLKKHPRISELNGKDVIKILDAQNQIPYLFERLMIVAHQKHEPTFSRWIKQGDKESLDKFREKFEALAKDYAARFVGSLFCKARLYDFESSLPHNKGKSRLDLVLQSIGYNARNDLPDMPREQWFTNKIEPDYTSQWGIDAVNARKCRPITRGSGVIVAVIDSGIDPYNSLFKDKLVPGFNFLQRTTPPWSDEQPPMIDWGFHGTATASTVLMITPDSRIMPVRVFDSDTMNDPPMDYWINEFIAAGIYYAVNHGAHVIQLSGALKSTEPVVVDAVRYAYYHNVVICSSAGNIPRAHFGVKTEEVMYRAFEDEVLLVGGVGKEDARIRPSSFSVPGPNVDVAAPAENVFVIFPVYMKEYKNDYVAGTSLSSPIASGVVALMRSAAPPPEELLKKPGAYCRLVSRCLRETARLDILGLVEPNDVVGQGLIDTHAAGQMIQRLLKVEK